VSAPEPATPGPLLVHDVDLRSVAALLCDADDNLFPSEAPAFVASTEVVNTVMEEIGAPRRYEPEQLRLTATGKTFRVTIADLVAGVTGATPSDADIERWVAEEKRAVSAHLGRTLVPDLEVVGVLRRLGERLTLAAVSSSALSRLDACFAVTGLAELLPPERRFSAEDSLPRPTSKPDPAVYRLACRRLGLPPERTLAIEDSPTGARSAVAAGIPTIGNLRFVAPSERDRRTAELIDAGVCAILTSWTQLERLLDGVAATAQPTG
jgi:beta-phosphoglucomutase-like phosphatase (HAD superfamily)